MISSASTARREPAPDGLRVLVVEDSAVMRGLLTRWLQAAEGVGEVRSCANGLQCLDAVRLSAPDVILLDLEMPQMDGIEALPHLRRIARDTAIVVTSSLTPRGADFGLRCLDLGARHIVPKPTTASGEGVVPAYRAEIVETVRSLGLARRRGLAGRRALAPEAAAPASIAPAPRRAARTSAPARERPKAILVGASTGGPQALAELMAGIKSVVAGTPVLIVQHMPRVFTGVLATHLAASTGLNVTEAREGDEILPGRVLIAPGGLHMTVRGPRESGRPATVALEDGPPVRFAKPSVDCLFTSAVETYRGATLGIVLTGMGSDGCDGAKAIVGAGGLILAQDEATSVVWGMPGAVTRAGHAGEVLPLPALGPRIVQLVSAAGQRS